MLQNCVGKSPSIVQASKVALMVARLTSRAWIWTLASDDCSGLHETCACRTIGVGLQGRFPERKECATSRRNPALLEFRFNNTSPVRELKSSVMLRWPQRRRTGPPTAYRHEYRIARGGIRAPTMVFAVNRSSHNHCPAIEVQTA